MVTQFDIQFPNRLWALWLICHQLVENNSHRRYLHKQKVQDRVTANSAAQQRTTEHFHHNEELDSRMRLVAFSQALQHGLQLCYSSLVYLPWDFDAVLQRAFFLDQEFWCERYTDMPNFQKAVALLGSLTGGGPTYRAGLHRNTSILAELYESSCAETVHSNHELQSVGRHTNRSSKTDWKTLPAEIIQEAARADQWRALNQGWRREMQPLQSPTTWSLLPGASLIGTTLTLTRDKIKYRVVAVGCPPSWWLTQNGNADELEIMVYLHPVVVRNNIQKNTVISDNRSCELISFTDFSILKETSILRERSRMLIFVFKPQHVSLSSLLSFAPGPPPPGHAPGQHNRPAL